MDILKVGDQQVDFLENGSKVHLGPMGLENAAAGGCCLTDAERRAGSPRRMHEGYELSQATSRKKNNS